MIQKISISQARQRLPSLINRVYQGEEFIIEKNKIPVAYLSPIDKKKTKPKEKKILPQATKLLLHLKGDATEVADYLRKTAWEGSYAD